MSVFLLKIPVCIYLLESIIWIPIQVLYNRDILRILPPPHPPPPLRQGVRYGRVEIQWLNCKAKLEFAQKGLDKSIKTLHTRRYCRFYGYCRTSNFNEPLRNEVLGITNDFLYPTNSIILLWKRTLT